MFVLSSHGTDFPFSESQKNDLSKKIVLEASSHVACGEFIVLSWIELRGNEDIIGDTESRKLPTPEYCGLK